MSAFLPQTDPNKAQRQADIEKAKKEYQWNHTYISPLAMVQRVPEQDEWSLRWKIAVLFKAFHVIENQLADEGFCSMALKGLYNYFRKKVQYRNPSSSTLKIIYQEVLSNLADRERPQSIDDYAKLFRRIQLPPINRNYTEDVVFASMRVAGPNPLMIQQISQMDPRFPVTEEHFRVSQSGDTLEAAASEGRLYLADYQMLEALDPGTVDEGGFKLQKYVYAPLALFVVSKATRELMPVAIQCQQLPGPTNPIFTPKDGHNWLIAKTIVEMADGNVHEPVSHLGRTHLFIEPFPVALGRNLASNHPVYRLLKPHFEGTLAINDSAQRNLVADGGPVDRLLSGTIDSAKKLVAKDLEDHPFNKVMLPDTFNARGVADREQLPYYPFRDDALLFWDAIRVWVADYLALYYQQDSDVAEDTELASWCQDLASAEGGRVFGLGDNGKINTFNQLADSLTLIIYTGSVQHAAVNFPQYDLMTYCPNLPLAAYQPAPTSTGGGTQQDYLNILPPMDQAEAQLNLLYVLGTVHYTTLGEYDSDQFSDERVKKPLQKFQKRLDEIKNEINERNRNRRPYDTLLPGSVPQSINI